MILPRSISVKVLDGVRPVAALVWLNLLAHGNDFYCTHVGLTNAAGIARITDRELRADFDDDRSMFLMDYKLPIADCDDEIVLGIEGGASFIEHRQTALSISFVTSAAKQRWAEAVNASLPSVSARRRLSSDVAEDVTVILRLA